LLTIMLWHSCDAVEPAIEAVPALCQRSRFWTCKK
jgi:hypothetical protein